jgi:hypothetical protein
MNTADLIALLILALQAVSTVIDVISLRTGRKK